METNLHLASTLLETLIQNGCHRFVFSPGARNSPLIRSLYLLAESRSLEIDSHFDERGAGFYALGMAKVSSGPVCVITTSGSATANLLPVMVEAFYSAFPLIALTSDRPRRLHDISSNQTINQKKIYNNFVHAEVQLPSLENGQLTKVEQNEIVEKVKRALSYLKKGPIHINCPFDEPLLGETISHELLELLAEQNYRIYSKGALYKKIPNKNDLEEFYSLVKRSHRGLLIVGELKQNYDKDDLVDFIRFLGHYGWLVILEVNSGIRHLFSKSRREKFVLENYSHLLKKKRFVERLGIDSIVHLGGRLLTKSLSTFIKQTSFVDYIHIDDHPLHYDPEKKITKHYQYNPFYFSKAAYNFWFKSRFFLNAKNDILLEEIKNVDNQLSKQLHEFSFNYFNELELSRTINHFSNQAFLEDNAILFLGNSMAVRDFNLISREVGFVKVFTNRGASGIDGLIATASGIAKANPEYRLYTMIGDLSALHDLNSLVYLKKNQDSKCPMTLIIINNHEGTIFRYLPLSKVIDQYPQHKSFYARHELDFKKVSANFGIDYLNVNNSRDLFNALKSYRSRPNSVVIEVSVEPDKNYSEHIRYHIDVMNLIDRLLG